MGLSNKIIALLNFLAILSSIAVIALGIWLASKSDNLCNQYLKWPVLVLGILLLLVSASGFVGAFWYKKGFLRFYLFCMAILIILLLVLLVFAFVVTRPDGSYPVPGTAYKEYRLGGFSSWLRGHVVSSGNWRKIRDCLLDSDNCSEMNGEYVSAEQFFIAHLSPIQASAVLIFRIITKSFLLRKSVCCQNRVRLSCEMFWYSVLSSVLGTSSVLTEGQYAEEMYDYGMRMMISESLNVR